MSQNKSELRLPVDVIPNTDPPIFKWKQIVNTAGGQREVIYEGPMPLTAETAIAELVALCKRQAKEIETLKKKLDEKVVEKLDAEVIKTPQPVSKGKR